MNKLFNQDKIFKFRIRFVNKFKIKIKKKLDKYLNLKDIVIINKADWIERREKLASLVANNIII